MEAEPVAISPIEVQCPPQRSRPARVWSVWAVPVVALVVSIVMQVVVVVVLAVSTMAKGGQLNPADVTGEMAKPWVLIASMVGTQVCFAVATAAAAMLSPERFRERLGWVRPATPLRAPFPAWGWIAIPLGAWIPAALGMMLARLVPWSLMPAEQIEKLWSTLSVGQTAAYVGMIAILPGVIEESLFRGYMQRRLLKRWSPAMAIGAASAAFAMAHMDPQTAVFAFPIGVWLGIIARRCGSVLPCMVAHAFINGTWSIFQITAHQGVIGETAQVWIVVGTLIVSAAGFAATLRLMR